MYGERIRGRREALGLSWTELSSKIEVPITRLVEWESEQSAPSIQELITLARVLMVTVDWLVGAVDSMYDDLFDEEEFFEDMFDDEELEEYSDKPFSSFSDEDDFQEMLIDHAKRYTSEHNAPAYIHINIAEDGNEDDDCVLYTGDPAAILTATNILIDSMAEILGTNYYDLIVKMATTHTQASLDSEDDSRED